MTKYLSQEWLDRTRGARRRPARAAGCDRRASSDVVNEGPDGDIKYWWRLEDGQLLESRRSASSRTPISR